MSAVFGWYICNCLLLMLVQHINGNICSLFGDRDFCLQDISYNNTMTWHTSSRLSANRLTARVCFWLSVHGRWVPLLPKGMTSQWCSFVAIHTRQWCMTMQTVQSCSSRGQRLPSLSASCFEFHWTVYIIHFAEYIGFPKHCQRLTSHFTAHECQIQLW